MKYSTGHTQYENISSIYWTAIQLQSKSINANYIMHSTWNLYLFIIVCCLYEMLPLSCMLLTWKIVVVTEHEKCVNKKNEKTKTTINTKKKNDKQSKLVDKSINWKSNHSNIWTATAHLTYIRDSTLHTGIVLLLWEFSGRGVSDYGLRFFYEKVLIDSQ